MLDKKNCSEHDKKTSHSRALRYPLIISGTSMEAFDLDSFELIKFSKRISSVQLILFGKIAETIPQNKLSVGLIAEHPYNINFITNQKVIEIFKPLDLFSHE